MLTSRISLDKTLAALRGAGYAPVAEAADGAVRIERPRHRRAAAPVPPPRRSEGASDRPSTYPIVRNGDPSTYPTARNSDPSTNRIAPNGAPSTYPTVRSGEAPPVGVDVSALAATLRDAPPIAPAPDPENGVPFATDVEEITATYARLLPLADVRQLSHAIVERRAVTIEYVDASGNRTVRTISDIDFDPPYLYAWCHLRDDDRVFALSRIHGIMPA